MKIFGYSSVLLLILSQTSIVPCFCTITVDKTGSNGYETFDTFRIKIEDYFVPFENCTTMVFTKVTFALGMIHVPIISFVYDTNTTLGTGGIIHDKFSIVRKRNSAPHCWATFAILPETASLFDQDEYINLPPFIYRTWRSHYFIMITAVIHEVEGYLRQYSVLSNLHLVQVILVDITQENNSLLRFGYHNIYHIKKPAAIGMEKSEAWYPITCAPAHCFDQLVLLDQNVSRLNKYFWTAYVLGPNIPLLSDLVDHIDLRNKCQSRHAFQRIADVTSFHGFLSYLILQDVLIYDFKYSTPFHTFESMYGMHFQSRGGFGFIMNDVQKYSFISCYGIRRNSEMLGSLSSPFDMISWACIGTCFTTVVLILTLTLGRYLSDGVFVVIGISLENSTSLPVYENRFTRKGYPSPGVCTLVAIWSIFVGTILRNWYKSCFTMELIVPTVYESPWTSVMDVEQIRILMPFGLLGGNTPDWKSLADFFRYKLFYLKILQHCIKIRKGRGDNKLGVVHKKVAENLVKRLIPHFGMDNNLRTVRNATFSPIGGLNDPHPLYEKTALKDYPIHPVKYDEPDSYGVITTLKTCEKVALMDTKENIATITNFLNDRDQKLKYLMGDGDSFFTRIRGWVIPPVRNNYVEKRLKVFISSGILEHFKVLYKLWEPTNIPWNYTARIGPKVEAVSRLDFSSKVTAGFYVSGMGLILCILVLLAEIVNQKYKPKFNYWLCLLVINLF
ncbi:hypothetical protein Fcan01_24827 [Folsomia candida]|uniref:Uncharacterized protein n=1 Tax=Folsomia candida TaxID=158441 RepID=A0A226D4S3_FOLCA|nr:hypothetical protein Fcan01_24827 [Folsomia candida]